MPLAYTLAHATTLFIFACPGSTLRPTGDDANTGVRESNRIPTQEGQRGYRGVAPLSLGARKGEKRREDRRLRVTTTKTKVMKRTRSRRAWTSTWPPIATLAQEQEGYLSSRRIFALHADDRDKHCRHPAPRLPRRRRRFPRPSPRRVRALSPTSAAHLLVTDRAAMLSPLPGPLSLHALPGCCPALQLYPLSLPPFRCRPIHLAATAATTIAVAIASTCRFSVLPPGLGRVAGVPDPTCSRSFLFRSSRSNPGASPSIPISPAPRLLAASSPICH
ncbi:hypothetical protein MSAN_00313400 [Mycena sanguinolenta]|uniref:Uncharacterized protein n=1 Tax=Mycena sanguinolenta TaxID=230812 RepID=A0A8H6ZBE8_9AGAR|nr:hypothetical protein MSAN_00313400 [Mycena sanguinolenta]